MRNIVVGGLSVKNRTSSEEILRNIELQEGTDGERLIFNGENDFTSACISEEVYSCGVVGVRVGCLVKEGGFSEASDAVSVALDVGEIRSCMADYLYSTVWCRPFFADSLENIPVGTLGLLYERSTGGYGFILPVCGERFVTRLASHDGRLFADISAASWRDENGTVIDRFDEPSFVFGEGSDPYKLLRDCAAAAVKLIGKHSMLRDERKYPELFEYLGWCSWDSMEIWVDEIGIREKFGEFRDKKIPVRWGIIDDMWAEVEWTQKLPKFTSHDISFGVMHSSKLKDFEADGERFPSGLKKTLDGLKADFGVKIGMWHPTPGYWSGIAEGSPAYDKLEGCIVKLPNGKYMPDLGSPEKAFEFYHSFHDFLYDCGADFLKVDNQSFIRQNYNGTVPLGTAAHNMHSAIEGTVGSMFGGTLINCMGMANENTYNRTASAVARCSDDFQPENRAWFAHHITQCTYNSLVAGQYFYSDFDMWWSGDSQARKNSVLRAVSGGPIYVSDRIGQSDASVFEPLTLSDGRILRCRALALPTKDWLCSDPTESADRAYTVFNLCGYSIGEEDRKCAVVAAYDLFADGRAAYGELGLDNLPADAFGGEHKQYLVYDYFEGHAELIGANEKIRFTLENCDSLKLYVIIPAEEEIIPIGLRGKYVAPETIESVDFIDGGDTCFVKLREGGECLVCSETKLEFRTVSGELLGCERLGALYTVNTGTSRCFVIKKSQTLTNL